MKTSITAAIVIRKIALSLAILATTPLLHANPVVDWGTGLWNQGGANSVGYQNLWISGTTPTDGTLTAVSTYTTGGTISANDGNLTVTNVLSGGPAPLPKSLRLQQSNDENSGSTLTDFSKVTLTFNAPVTLKNPFTLFDVDIGGGWQDFVIVTASLAGSPLATTYTPNSPYNGTFTGYGSPGILGLTSATNESAQGNVGISFSVGSFDRIEIVYTQAPGAGPNSHGIGISNLDLNIVPEPSATTTLALAGIGLALLRFRSRSRAS